MARLKDGIAAPGVAPLSWQTEAPRSLYSRRAGPPIEWSPEIDRILALPRREPLDLNSHRAAVMNQLITSRYAKANPDCRCRTIDPQRFRKDGPGCITRLLPIQSWMLYEMGIVGGMVGSVAVGAGKTIVGLLALLAMGLDKGLLLIPPSLTDQLVTDYDLLAEHFRVPSLVMCGVNKTARTQKDAPVLYVLPYSQLSAKEYTTWVEELNPEVIIADECDRLSDPQTSTTSRVARAFAKNPSMKFAGWTGSILNHTIAQMWHLFVWALREYSPMPIDFAVVEDWARCVDPVTFRCPEGALRQLCQPGEDVRHGFQRRLRETMGVVFTGENEVRIEATGELIEVRVDERAAPKLPPIINTALAFVRKNQRPDTLVGGYMNEELVDALAVAKCATEVATGMFYTWEFPPIDGVPQKVITIKEWYKRRKEYNCELRDKLMPREEHLDSPHLCEIAAQRYYGMREQRKDRPDWESKAYLPWIEIKDQVKWRQKANRLHDYLVQDAATWARENRGIVWYTMVEFGQWLAEVTGFPLHTGGPQAGKKIKRETGETSIIASIKSHGRGRNGLQFLYDCQLISNIFASATIGEQLLGRLHRRGQTSHIVRTWVYLHTPEFQKSWNQVLTRAEFVKAMTGAGQKVLVYGCNGQPADLG